MTLKFKTEDLTQAEASLIGWHVGYSEEDDPYYVSLWHTVNRAWVATASRYAKASQDRTSKTPARVRRVPGRSSGLY